MRLACFYYALLLLYVVIARFLYCTFIMYSAIRLSSRNCARNSVFNVTSSINLKCVSEQLLNARHIITWRTM